MFTIIGLIQHKGWQYHFYPANSLAALVLMIIVINLHSKPTFLIKKLVYLTAIIFIFFEPVKYVTNYFHWVITDGKPGITGTMVEILKEYSGGGGFAMLSTKINPAFPAANYTGEKWVLRYPHLWPLPGFYSAEDIKMGKIVYHDSTNMTKEEAEFKKNVIDDMINNYPKLIFVEDGPYKFGFSERGLDFDYIEYFTSDERFAEFWKNYSLLGKMESDLMPISVWIRE